MPTYIARIQHCSIIPPNLGKSVALVAQQPVHIPDEAQVVLVPARLADGAPPLLDGLEDLCLDTRGTDGRALGEAADQLVEELLGADLQVEGVAAVLDADVEQVQGQQGDVGVAVIDIANDGHGGLAWGGALLRVDQVRDLEV